jgi:hypothetical protein
VSSAVRRPPRAIPWWSITAGLLVIGLAVMIGDGGPQAER